MAALAPRAQESIQRWLRQAETDQSAVEPAHSKELMLLFGAASPHSKFRCLHILKEFFSSLLEVFPYFQQHPEEYEIFNRAMTSFSTNALPALVEAYDFSGVKTLVDIAGGHGMLLAGFLKANPQLKGMLFDLPQVIESAPALLAKEGVADRVELKSGDFFESVPEGAGAYMMKFIIHDWDDERALNILQNIHRAAAAGARLLLVEMVVPVGNEPHFSKIQDLEMLVSPGGVERTEKEYRELLAQAGFELRRIIPTRSPLSIVEAFAR